MNSKEKENKNVAGRFMAFVLTFAVSASITILAGSKQAKQKHVSNDAQTGTVYLAQAKAGGDDERPCPTWRLPLRSVMHDCAAP